MIDLTNYSVNQKTEVSQKTDKVEQEELRKQMPYKN